MEPSSKRQVRAWRITFRLLYPSVSFAEMLLFFFALFLALVENHPAFFSWFGGLWSRLFASCLHRVDIAHGFLDHLAAYGQFAVGLLGAGWLTVIALFLVVLPLAGVVGEALRPRNLEFEDKRDVAYLVQFFFMASALVGGLAAYLQIQAAWRSPGVTEEVVFRLVVTILFFLHRAVAFALALMQPEEKEDERVHEELFAERISGRAVRRPAVLLALAAGAAIYLLLRGSGAGLLGSVLLTYVYGSILLQLFAWGMDRFGGRGDPGRRAGPPGQTGASPG